jgi:hypothetical protein
MPVSPQMPPPPIPGPPEVIGQAKVAADNRDRGPNNQGDRVGENRGRDTDRGQAGKRPARRGRREGETGGRDTERGEKIPVPAAEDPGAGSSNRGGPDRGRSRSARLKHKEKLARTVTKVQQQIGILNDMVNKLLVEIAQTPE